MKDATLGIILHLGVSNGIPKVRNRKPLIPGLMTIVNGAPGRAPDYRGTKGC